MPIVENLVNQTPESAARLLANYACRLSKQAADAKPSWAQQFGNYVNETALKPMGAWAAKNWPGLGQGFVDQKLNDVGTWMGKPENAPWLAGGIGALGGAGLGLGAGLLTRRRKSRALGDALTGGLLGGLVGGGGTWLANQAGINWANPPAGSDAPRGEDALNTPIQPPQRALPHQVESANAADRLRELGEQAWSHMPSKAKSPPAMLTKPFEKLKQDQNADTFSQAGQAVHTARVIPAISAVGSLIGDRLSGRSTIPTGALTIPAAYNVNAPLPPPPVPGGPPQSPPVPGGSPQSPPPDPNDVTKATGPGIEARKPGREWAEWLRSKWKDWTTVENPDRPGERISLINPRDVARARFNRAFAPLGMQLEQGSGIMSMLGPLGGSKPTMITHQTAASGPIIVSGNPVTIPPGSPNQRPLTTILPGGLVNPTTDPRGVLHAQDAKGTSWTSGNSGLNWTNPSGRVIMADMSSVANLPDRVPNSAEIPAADFKRLQQSRGVEEFLNRYPPAFRGYLRKQFNAAMNTP